jgi:hypothetical protein
MKINTRITLIFSCMVFLFLSCSKDKMLERRLHKKEGQWNIDQVDWTIVYQSSSGQVIRSGTTYNAGTFTFEKNDVGRYSYAVDTFQRSGAFRWKVDNQKVSVVSINQTFSFSSSPTISQSAVAYTATEPGKNSLIMEGTETQQEYTGGISQFVLTGKFYMSK